MGGAKNARTGTRTDEVSGPTIGIEAPAESGKSSEFIRKAAFKNIEDLSRTKVRLKSGQKLAVVEILRYAKERDEATTRTHINQTNASRTAS